MNQLSAIDRLRALLRLPGKGLYVHSTGGGYAERVLKLLYGTDDLKAMHQMWEDGLQKIRRIEAVVLGVPSDTGASIMRGANFGPLGVREAYLTKYGSYPKGVLDIGDVLVVPQLLHDEMLSRQQILQTRMAIYGKDIDLPVGALSMAEAALSALHELNPNLKVYLIGGDHSVSWPAAVYCSKKHGKDFAILHFDAHTDMLEHRLGVRYCFATWAFHAHKLMKPYHLVQVGIRTSARSKDEWAKLHPFLQFWAFDVLGHEKEAIPKILQHFSDLGVKNIYISNDIDGTDSKFAPATGTPEENGLTPAFVHELIQETRKNFSVTGGDVVEVAPPLSGSRDFATDATCLLGADYLHAFLK